MERGEENAQETYKKISTKVPEAEEILHQEEVHKEKILNLINEELLKYISLVVLGLK